MKNAVLIFIFLFSSQLFAQTNVDNILTKLKTCDESTVLVAAHRGDWRNYPENSLEGINSAIEMGVDIVELDLQCTKDSVLILMHDNTLDRTTTGKGNVSKYTLDEIRKLNLRNGCAIKTIHKIPTLEEALLLVKGKILVNLDKADRYFDMVVPLLEKTGTTKQVIMKGRKSVKEVKSLYGHYLRDVIYMPIVDLDNQNAEIEINKFVSDLSPVAFELLFEKDSNKLPYKIKETLKGKSLIWYNTLWNTMAGGHDDDMSLGNLEDGYGYLIDKLGCRIIQTDRPAYLLTYLRSRNLHK